MSTRKHCILCGPKKMKIYFWNTNLWRLQIIFIIMAKNEIDLTLFKLGQYFETTSSPARGLRNRKCLIFGKDVMFVFSTNVFAIVASSWWHCSLSNILMACWTVLFCPLFASILSSKFRFSRHASIPLEVTSAQLLIRIVDNV